MDLKLKFGENYILLAGLRQYIEHGVMLSSVNFWRDSFQDFQESRAVDKRSEILKTNNAFEENEFLVSFVNENFPVVEDHISDDVIPTVLKFIEQAEGSQTASLTKEFLIQYAIFIAKSSKEDYLAFVGIKDSISDEEQVFIEKIKHLFDEY
jgi:hypothetical protein